MQTVDRTRHPQPFAGGLNTHAFHPSPEHNEALARLNFLVENRRRLGVLVGPSGSGKSLLLRVFAEQLARTGSQVAVLNLLDVEPTEFLWLLAAQLGINPSATESTASLWRKINDRLTEFRYQQSTAVLLLDSGEEANAAVLQHVARLANFDPTPETRLTIVLAGRKEMLARLNNTLADLVDLRIGLDSWNTTETAQFVNDTLVQSSGNSPRFAPSAVERLQELTAGNPRRVAQLASLSVVAATGQNLPQINAAIVENVFQELIPPLGTGV